MSLQVHNRGRVLSLHAAAKRLQIPERTLRYQARRGWVQGAFKQGKLWKFPLSALEIAGQKRERDVTFSSLWQKPVTN
jgi:hypothetical protein